MEDIDNLIANNQISSRTFYVDSVNRNRSLYAKPQEYSIPLATAFKNVCAIQVIDASIPRTHYNCDVNTNRFVYQVFVHDEWTSYSIELPVGNYQTDDVLTRMNSELSYITIRYASYPHSFRKQFRFESDYMFEINLLKTSLKSLLGFDQLINPTVSSVVDDAYFTNVNILTTISSSLNVTHELRKESIVYVNITKPTNSIYFMSRFELTISSVNSTCSCVISLTTNERIILYTYEQLLKIDENEIKLDAIAQRVEIPEDCYISIHFKNASENFKCSVHTNESASNFAIVTNTNQPVINTETANVALNCNLTIKKHNHTIIPPGVYNMVGDRYIVLRCKEIDDHVGTSISTFNQQDEEGNVKERTFNFGIAKFKLGVSGFSDERFDYNNLQITEFHPIGKLSALSLRFEKPNGELYDFKGVNHTLTFQLHFYTPQLEFSKRKDMNRLNPAYNPNYFDS